MLLIPFLLVTSLQSTDFDALMSVAKKDLGAIEREAKELIESGQPSAAQRFIAEALPAEERSAAHYFILGNVWFSIDHEYSMEMHRQAFALAPDSEDVQREWAMQLHRAGEYAAAAKLYGELPFKSPEESAMFATLYAECLLYQGEIASAIQAWQDTMSLPDRRAVAGILQWIHAEQNSMGRRGLYLESIARGEDRHAEDLTLLDLGWSPAHQGGNLRFLHLEEDVPRIMGLLGKETQRARDLMAIVELRFIAWEQGYPTSMDSVPRAQTQAAVIEHKWTGIDARLPTHAGVAHCVLQHLISQDMGGAHLLALHEPELIKRHKESDADGLVARTLVMLAKAANSVKLEQFQAMVPPSAIQIAEGDLHAAGQEPDAQRKAVVPLLLAHMRSKLMDVAATDALFKRIAQR